MESSPQSSAPAQELNENDANAAWEEAGHVCVASALQRDPRKLEEGMHLLEQLVAKSAPSAVLAWRVQRVLRAALSSSCTSGCTECIRLLLPLVDRGVDARQSTFDHWRPEMLQAHAELAPRDDARPRGVRRGEIRRQPVQCGASSHQSVGVRPQPCAREVRRPARGPA